MSEDQHITRIEPTALTEAWANMEDNLEAPGGKPWSRVKGLMGATYMHLRDMGWSAQFEFFPEFQMVGLADRKGNKWEFNNAISWHELQEKQLVMGTGTKTSWGPRPGRGGGHDSHK